MKLKHDTLAAAKRELVTHKYNPLAMPLTTQTQAWARPGDAKWLAIGGDADGVWHIVPYLEAAKSDWLD
jgi:hypothetical protein